MKDQRFRWIVGCGAAAQAFFDDGTHGTYNVEAPDAADTFCPSCKKKVIERYQYTISANNLKAGKCGFCGEKIAGIW